MGRTGLQVSEICLGTMTFGSRCDEETSRAIMDAALDGGVYFFDTADRYPMGAGPGDYGRSEEIIGRWMKGRRHDIVIATKCRNAMGSGPNDQGLSRKHIMDAVEASLRRLQTDHIDLYQAHAPDPGTPLDETLRAFDDLVRHGKVRYIGCSNYPGWQLALSLWTSDKLGLTRFDCVQPRYNILFREFEAELFPLCIDQGVGIIPFNPLAGGFLTGKYAVGEEPPKGTRFDISKGAPASNYRARYWHEAHSMVVRSLADFMQKRGKSLTQAAIAWVLAKPGITAPIVGASSLEQLKESLGAADITLDDEEMSACDDAWFGLPRSRDPNVAYL